jgi:hypothetical protein
MTMNMADSLCCISSCTWSGESMMDSATDMSVHVQYIYVQIFSD